MFGRLPADGINRRTQRGTRMQRAATRQHVAHGALMAMMVGSFVAGCAGHPASTNVTIDACVGHCGNGIQDCDETGLDCGGGCSACTSAPAAGDSATSPTT